MFPYIFIIIILLFGAAAEVFGVVKNIKIYFVVCAILIALFAGLRYNTGADWEVYIPTFYEMPKLGNIHNWEIGYYWVSIIFYYLFGDYYVFQLAASVFLMYSVARFLWKYTNYPIFSLLLFFMMFINNGILMAQVRQSIALAILLFGYEHILNKSFGKFMTVVIMACLFHISAIVALPMYFMTRKIPNYILIILILFFQIFYFVPGTAAHIVKIFLPYMPGRLEEIGHLYLNHVLYGSKVQFNTGMYYIASVLLSTIVIYFNKDKNSERSFWLNSLAVAMIIGALSSSIPIIGRFKAYYLIFALGAYQLIFNLKISKITHKTTSLIIMLLLFCFFFIPLHRKLTSTDIDAVTGFPMNHTWNPYYNVVSHPEDVEYRKEYNKKELNKEGLQQ